MYKRQERPYIPTADWDAFEVTEVRRMTRPCENLHTWAVTNLRKGSWTNTDMTQVNSCKDEVWSTFVRLLEMSAPGLTQQLSKEMTLDLGAKYGEGIAAVDGDHWVHVDDVKERMVKIVRKTRIQYNGLPAKFAPKTKHQNKYPKMINTYFQILDVSRNQ